jgi:hypothetical protein
MRVKVQSFCTVSILHSFSLLFLVLFYTGCASSKTEVEKAAKDWCMTVRGSQVIPVYPLTEDIQPGDIFLVQVPVDKQQLLYEQHGFLALDNHLGRMNPTGYQKFYEYSFFRKGETNELPRDWIRPSGTNHSWRLAPHAAFPSYSFSVRNGAGVNLAVPVQGVPVGLSLLASDAASGTIEIKDAYSMGVDTVSLYRQVEQWAETNADFLRYFGASAPGQKTNFLRVVTRIYATGKMSVSLKDASSRSGGLDAGVPKPVDLLAPTLPANSTNVSEATVQNYTNAWGALSQVVQAATMAKDAAGNILPGGSLRLTAASARTVSLDEEFDPPIVFGYLAFDCAIEAGGEIGAPIPTYAILDRSFNLKDFVRYKGLWKGSTNAFDTIEANYATASPVKKDAIRKRAAELGLIVGEVSEDKFIKILRRSVDGNDAAITQKFRQLADFSVQTP